MINASGVQLVSIGPQAVLVLSWVDLVGQVLALPRADCFAWYIGCASRHQEELGSTVGRASRRGVACGHRASSSVDQLGLVCVDLLLRLCLET